MLYAIKRNGPSFYLRGHGDEYWTDTLSKENVWDGHDVILRLLAYNQRANRSSEPQGILAETGVRIVPVVERVVEQVSYQESL